MPSDEGSAKDGGQNVWAHRQGMWQARAMRAYLLFAPPYLSQCSLTSAMEYCADTLISHHRCRVRCSCLRP